VQLAANWVLPARKPGWIRAPDRALARSRRRVRAAIALGGLRARHCGGHGLGRSSRGLRLSLWSRDILRSEVNGILVREGDVAGLAAALPPRLGTAGIRRKLRQTARVDATRMRSRLSQKHT